VRPKALPFAPICYHEVSCVETMFKLGELRIPLVDGRLVIITILRSFSRYFPSFQKNAYVAYRKEASTLSSVDQKTNSSDLVMFPVWLIPAHPGRGPTYFLLIINFQNRGLATVPHVRCTHLRHSSAAQQSRMQILGLVRYGLQFHTWRGLFRSADQCTVDLVLFLVRWRLRRPC
jgi:hypothetical protein